MMQALSSVVVIGAASFIAAFMALYMASALAGRRATPRGLDEADPEEERAPIAILYRNGEIRDVSGPGADLLEETAYDSSDWQRLHALFAPRFRDFPEDPPEACDLRLPALDTADTAEARLTARDGTIRIAVTERSPATDADRHLRHLTATCLRRSQRAVAAAPFPIWTTDADHSLCWANDAYRRIGVPDVGRTGFAAGLPLPRDTSPVTARVDLDPAEPDGPPRWYDVTIQRDGDVWLHYAMDISPVILAEVARQNFVQTLTKTFALLSTGLAIFGRDRRLTLFNPAMLDLTGLQPDFLTARPSLSGVFEALRERRVMPEPKSFRSWRETISDLEARATEGRFSETWTLPDGLTYQITGRPYPNGAIAFLLEDISDEIGMSRRFQEFTGLAQSALDTFDEAIAIFSPAARLTMMNAAYRDLWDLPEDGGFARTGLESTRDWQARTEPTPTWGDVRDFMSDFGARAEWQAEVRMKDGRRLQCRFAPLGDGSTLAGFTELD